MYNVSVYPCLPHRSLFGGEMWPYNTSNAFAASHTCCSLGNKVSYQVEVNDQNIPVQLENSFGSRLTGITVKDDQETVIFSDDSTTNFDAPLNQLEVTSDTITFVVGSSGVYNITLESFGLPDWGNYLPSSTVCHGGIPMIGHFQSFVATDPVHPELAPPVIGTPNVPGGINAARNDVFAITSERHCSGDRGNICSGDAVVGFDLVKSCDHFDTKWGESEHCTGVHKDAPLFLTPTEDLCDVDDDCPGYSAGNGNQRCFSGTCFEAPDSSYFDCNPYGEQGILEIYESYNGISTQAGIESSGYCNTFKSCSDDPWFFNFQESGKYLLPNLTCLEGECKQSPVQGLDCELFNGYSDAGNGFTNNVRYCKKEGDHLFTSKFSCSDSTPDDGIYTPEDIGCYKALGSTALTTEQLCASCYNSNTPTGDSSMTGQWIPSKNLCCGDDIGEGGFPYDGALTSPYSDEPGTFQTTEKICDDVITDSNGVTHGIDNDCSGKANCEDTQWCANHNLINSGLRTDTTERYKHLDESGGLCCSTDSSCKNFMDPTGSNIYHGIDSNMNRVSRQKVDCNNNHCDCKPVGTYWAFVHSELQNYPYITTTSGQTIHTCIASSSEIQGELGGPESDRHIRLSGLSPSNSYVLHASFEGISPNSNCDSTNSAGFFAFQQGSILATKSQQSHDLIITPTGNELVIAFFNSIDEDCLVMLNIEKQENTHKKS